MSNWEVLARSNGEDERGCKGKWGGRRVLCFHHGHSVRVKGTVNGKESLVGKSENGVLINCGIPIKLYVG